MFYKSTDDNFTQILDGISIKTLVYGEKTLFSEFHIEKGSSLPEHSHPQEQTGRLIKGRIILTVGGEKMEMNPGDCWSIPGDLEHSAEIIKDSIAVEIFSPVREDYMQYYHK